MLLKRIVIACRRRALLMVCALLLCASALGQKMENSDEGKRAQFSTEAAATFNRRCTACHTYGRGVKIGPDLKGVSERHSREWLIRFIAASSKLIQSRDPVATSLFVQFRQQRMPDWADLTDQQIGDILDYIEMGGPDIKPADERNADLATAAETNEGRRLFLGDVRFQYGAHACATCHSVSGSGLRGGTLAPDLSNVYTNFQDRALTDFLRHPCFQSAPRPTPSADQYLTAQESFALKAFLHQVALQQRAAINSKPAAQVVLTQNAGSANRQATMSSGQTGKRSR